MQRAAWTLAALMLGLAAPATAQGLTNVIIGGGMQNCTSSNPPVPGTELSPNCAMPWVDILVADPALAGLTPERVRFDRLAPASSVSYRIDAEALAALAALPETLLPGPKRQRLLAALTALGARRVAAQQALVGLDRAALAAGEMAALMGELSPTELAALLHSCLEAKAREPRRVQARSVAYLSNAATADIYRSFLGAVRELAGARAPVIGFVTAASANPYAEHDINLLALRSAGAEVIWLPFNGALRRALDHGQCAHLPILFDGYANTSGLRGQFHLELDYPDLAEQQRRACADPEGALNAALERIDGIFFAGGDQARLLESLVTPDAQGRYTRPSDQLQILRRRHAAGHLVVAGSSAGNAAQVGPRPGASPVPMISGGESWQVLAKGFVPGRGPTLEGASSVGLSYPEGGLGFFALGALDSHFSQRAREGRLLRFVQESGLDYGFGVDENTALLVERVDAVGATGLRVVGAGGVLVVDLRGARADRAPAGFALQEATLHYLQAGDRARVDAAGQLQVMLAPDKPLLAPVPDALAVQGADLQNPRAMNFVKLLQAMGRSGASQAFGDTAQAPRFSFRLWRTPASEFRAAGTQAVSYANVRLSLAPCALDCGAPQSATLEVRKVP